MYPTICLAITLVAVSAAGGQGKLEERQQRRRFISEKYRFSMSVPRSWIYNAKSDTPVYFNSPTQKFFQGRVPQGGAAIVVVADNSVSGQSRAEKTPQYWASSDVRGSSSGTPSIKQFEMPLESGASQAVMSSYREIGGTNNRSSVVSACSGSSTNIYSRRI